MADEDTAQPIPAPSEPAQPVSESIPAPATPPDTVEQTAQPETPTAQMPANEPLPPEPPPSHEATEGQSEPIAPEIPTSQPPTPSSSLPVRQSARDLLVKANATKQNRKRKKLDKIMEALNTKGKITNDEVEKLLHVSDATATRYLSALEKEGKIQQVGKTGKAVEYTRI